MIIEKYRTNLNDNVREYGDKLTFKLGFPKKFTDKFGLGTLLTKDANFKRVGAITGIISPYVGAYFLSANTPSDAYSNGLILDTLVIGGAGTILGIPNLTWALGKEAGEKLDMLIGKTSLKIRNIRYMRQYHKKYGELK